MGQNLWHLPLLGEISTFIHQLWRLGILRKSMVPGSWLMWRFPEMGVPLFIIHFRLGFSTISLISHFGAPQFMETLIFSWPATWPATKISHPATVPTARWLQASRVGMAYSTYKNGTGGWCKWHCFTHIRWLWAITWHKHAIILAFLKLRMVNHG